MRKSNNFFEFLDRHSFDLEIKRPANDRDRWYAKIKHAELHTGSGLLRTSGIAENSDAAIFDYVQTIKGKKIRVNGKDHLVPQELYFESIDLKNNENELVA